MPRTPRAGDRPFPWRCGACDADQVYRTTTPYKTSIKYEGRAYDVDVPDLEVPKCRRCGEVVFDNHAGDQIDRAFREQLGLLRPDQIRAGRTQLGLSQKELAAHLRVAEESISRWETGAQLQSRAADWQIRLYFELPSVRELLATSDAGAKFGETVKSSPKALPVRREPFVRHYAGNWSVLVSLLEQTPPTAVGALTREWPDVHVDCSSFWKAASRFAGRARDEQMHSLTRLLAAQSHPIHVQEQVRRMSDFLSSEPLHVNPVWSRLARFTHHVGAMAEEDAVPLLDNFIRILEVWIERAKPPLPQLVREEETSEP